MSAMGIKLNWSDLFTIKLKEHGISQSDIATILRIEMDVHAHFYFSGLIPSNLYLQNIECTETEIIYYWKSKSNEAECPHCNMVNTHAVGNYYARRIQDVPQLGKAVYHIVDSKNYYCENESCKAGKFIERFNEFIDEYSRKTIRFKNYCIERSLGCGCNEAEREIRLEGGIVSNDSIGRYIKGQAAKYIESNISQATVRVLAVDDINLRKGDSGSGCTVFIDQETHKILIIVLGTTKEAAAKVMELFPTAEFLSRDRATAYSSAGAELDFTQVADRFHLVTNAQTAVKDALMASIPANIFIRDGDGWVQIGKEPGTSDNNTSYFSVPEQAIEERIELAGLTAKQGQKYRETMKMLELADKGMKTADIAKELDIPYKNVQALRRSAVETLTGVEDKIKKRIEKQNGIKEQSAVEEKTMQTPGERAEKTVAGRRVEHSSKSIVEPYRETVIKMWQADGNHRTIYPVLQAEGYTGSKNAIYQYILKLGKESPDEMSRERR
jgi:transcriptional regulator